MATTDSGIPVVKGNVVNYTPRGISTPGSDLGSNVQTLADALNTKGFQGDAMIFDNFRCRLKELGGMFEDLLEDGFGLGDLFDSIKEPDLSALGDVLSALNPLNILKNLENLSVEGLLSGIGSIIEGSLNFITGIVEGVFSQIESAMKGIGSMFDEFGDRLGNLDQFISNTIQGIVSGVTDAIGHIGGAIENVISALTAPCPGDVVSPTNKVNSDIVANKALFESQIEKVKGNIVTIDESGHTTGKIQNITEKAVKKFAPNVIPLVAPGSPGNTGVIGVDGKISSSREDTEHEKVKTEVIEKTTKDVATYLSSPPKPVETKSSNDIFAPKPECESKWDAFDKMYSTILNDISRIGREYKTIMEFYLHVIHRDEEFYYVHPDSEKKLAEVMIERLSSIITNSESAVTLYDEYNNCLPESSRPVYTSRVTEMREYVKGLKRFFSGEGKYKSFDPDDWSMNVKKTDIIYPEIINKIREA
jgi:hypothetical protein